MIQRAQHQPVLISVSARLAAPTVVFSLLRLVRRERRNPYGVGAGEEGGGLRRSGAVECGEGIRVRGVRYRLGGARRVAAEGAVLGRGRRHQVLHHLSQGHLPRTPLNPPVSSLADRCGAASLY
jgi:hypothetical protein